MAKSLTSEEWKKIGKKLNENPARYGIPSRVYGSAVAGSFNIRKLGRIDKRKKQTWNFLADLCRRFDLLAIQEVMIDTSGLQFLKELMGPDYGLIVSDTTGAFPNEPGLDERLAFLYNKRVVEPKGVVTDVTYDRTKVMQTLAENFQAFQDAMAPIANKKNVKASDIGKIKMPTFLAFIRTPFAVEFELFGHPGAERIPFLAINAHLNFGNFLSDRKQEFSALLNWMVNKVHENDSPHTENILLLGDLNLDFDNPKKDLPPIIKQMEELQSKTKKEVHACAPFLQAHPNSKQMMADTKKPFTTNARINQTFDQIAVLSRDQRLKEISVENMGHDERGPDYGVIDFVNLFSEALLGHKASKLKGEAKTNFYKKFEHTVSDHMPLWLRFRLFDVPDSEVVSNI